MASNDSVPNRANWKIASAYEDIIKNKAKLKESYKMYMLMRTQKMFDWEGLPDTIPQKDLEYIIQMAGSATITMVKGKLYAFYAGLGGRLNEYYHPTIATVSNPYLEFSKNLEIGKECELILNDCYYYGLDPLMEKYSSLLTENDISIRMALINSRIPKIPVTDNDTAKDDAVQYLADIEDGKLGILAGKAFVDNLKTVDYANATGESGQIKDLIESEQYFKSHWYIDLGLMSNFNMKREALNSNETDMGQDILMPLCDQMYMERKLGCERVNRMFGTNLDVHFSSSWMSLRATLEAQQDILEKQEGEPEQSYKEEDEETDDKIEHISGLDSKGKEESKDGDKDSR